MLGLTPVFGICRRNAVSEKQPVPSRLEAVDRSGSRTARPPPDHHGFERLFGRSGPSVQRPLTDFNNSIGPGVPAEIHLPWCHTHAESLLERGTGKFRSLQGSQKSVDEEKDPGLEETQNSHSQRAEAVSPAD